MTLAGSDARRAVDGQTDPSASASSPQAIRKLIREGGHTGPTSGLAPGRLQANLAIVPATVAADFLLFCTRNPKPCPLLAVCDPGNPVPPGLGEDMDLRTDLAGYRVFRNGVADGSVRDVSSVWRQDMVGFVIGCSFSFEEALMRAGVPVRNIAAKRNIPMYVTSLETRAAGPFAGPLVVTMRSFRPADAIAATIISDRYPLAHGAPVHIGDPAAIGIADIDRPDFGDPPVVEPGDIQVFWACGVTPQLAIGRARPDLAITHEPGHMLVTDLPADHRF